MRPTAGVCGPDPLGPLKLIQLIQFQAAGLGAFGPNPGALHFVSSASSGHGGGYIYECVVLTSSPI